MKVTIELESWQEVQQLLAGMLARKDSAQPVVASAACQCDKEEKEEKPKKKMTKKAKSEPEPVEETTPEPVEEKTTPSAPQNAAPTVTLKQLRTTVNKAAKQFGAIKIRDILAKYDAFTCNELEESQYAAVLADVAELC